MRTVEELEALLEVATRERDEARAEVERLSDASTHWQVMLKRETEEVYRLTNERDELLVRVEDQGAELRATREAYADAYRRGVDTGVEAMREAWCRMRALPIPEKP